MLITTTVLRRVAMVERVAAEEISTVQEVRYDVQVYGSEDDLAVIAPSPEHQRAPVDRVAKLFGHIEQARRDATTDARRAQIDEVSRAARDYIMRRHEAQMRGGGIREIILAGDQPRRAVVDAVQVLVDVNEKDLLAAANNSRRWHQLAIVFGAIIGALTLGALLPILFGIRRIVFNPLLELTGSIRRFTDGDRHVRARKFGAPEIADAAECFNELAGSIEGQHLHVLEFFDGVAHNLRSSVLAARAGIAALDTDHDLPTPEKIRARARVVNRELINLDRLLGDFVVASHTEWAKLELKLQRRDLRELARKSVELYESQSAAHQIRLSGPNHPLVIECDPDRIGQLLDSLLSNAMKRSPRGGLVNVTLGEERNLALISVTDHGPGIGEEELKHQFDTVEPAIAARGQSIDVGLGLSVARRIADAHQGRIEAQSKPGEGTTIRVHLPLAHQPAAEQERQPEHVVH
jgi:signal transduction histidine kinase